MIDLNQHFGALVSLIVFALVQLVITTRAAVLASQAIRKAEKIERDFINHLRMHAKPESDHDSQDPQSV